MNVIQESMQRLEIAKFEENAKWAVYEIRRLRQKTNRLIRVINEEDDDGDHVHNSRALSHDLVLEEEK